MAHRWGISLLGTAAVVALGCARDSSLAGPVPSVDAARSASTASAAGATSPPAVVTTATASSAPSAAVAPESVPEDWYAELARRMALGTLDLAGAIAFVGEEAGRVSQETVKVRPRIPGVVSATAGTLSHVAIDVALDLALDSASSLKLADLEAVFGPGKRLPRSPDGFSEGDRYGFRVRPKGAPYQTRVFAELTADKSRVARLHLDREQALDPASP